MATVSLIVEYDGTPFRGWQAQDGPSAPRTVQAELEAALSALCEERVRVRGASRTDAGVHARGQVAAFDTERERPLVAFERGPRLPREIAIRSAQWATPGFDPRRCSRGKRYVYTVFNDRGPTALDRDRAWWIRSPLDLSAMEVAAKDVVGTHDFDAFRARGCVARHAVRTIYAVHIRGCGPRVQIEVVGNAFVRNMVRILAGTLVEVGLGRRAPESVARALAGRQRTLAGVTAPAAGLCLEEVIYDDRLPPRPLDGSDRPT